MWFLVFVMTSNTFLITINACLFVPQSYSVLQAKSPIWLNSFEKKNQSTKRVEKKTRLNWIKLIADYSRPGQKCLLIELFVNEMNVNGWLRHLFLAVFNRSWTNLSTAEENHDDLKEKFILFKILRMNFYQKLIKETTRSLHTFNSTYFLPWNLPILPAATRQITEYASEVDFYEIREPKNGDSASKFLFVHCMCSVYNEQN